MSDKTLLLLIILIMIAFVLGVSYAGGANMQQLLSFGIQWASAAIGALLLLIRGTEKEKTENEKSNSGGAAGGGVGAGVGGS